jgi:hypothetical protein
MHGSQNHVEVFILLRSNDIPQSKCTSKRSKFILKYRNKFLEATSQTCNCRLFLFPCDTSIPKTRFHSKHHIC